MVESRNYPNKTGTSIKDTQTPHESAVPEETLNLLPDPMGDRVVTEVPKQVNQVLQDANLWMKKGIPNIKYLQEHMLREGKLSKIQVAEIVRLFSNSIKKDPNLVVVEQPVCIVGDIHGQYSDLVGIFAKYGDPSPSLNYLFLGDYVDRGCQGLEVCLLLFAMKLRFPKYVTMLRGNHESRLMTSSFTFRDEVLGHFDSEVYDLFMDCFDQLPIAAQVGKRYLCLHGGISPDLGKIDQINQIKRTVEVPEDGLFMDLLWADPIEDSEADQNFSKNYARDCSVYFGKTALQQFFKANAGLQTIIRAHQIMPDGYKLHKFGDSSGVPACITVFSAPNYCGSYNNKGAVLLLQDNAVKLQTYTEGRQKFCLEGGIDLFQLSIPILSSSIADVLMNIINQCTRYELNNAEDADVVGILGDEMGEFNQYQKDKELEAKVSKIAKHALKVSARKQEQLELIEESKRNSYSDGFIQQPIATKIQFQSKQFKAIKQIDAENEKRPVKKRVRRTKR